MPLSTDTNITGNQVNYMFNINLIQVGNEEEIEEILVLKNNILNKEYNISISKTSEDQMSKAFEEVFNFFWKTELTNLQNFELFELPIETNMKSINEKIFFTFCNILLKEMNEIKKDVLIKRGEVNY